MTSTNFNSIRRAVLKCLKDRAEIQAAYIFGSVAGGRPHSDSDIDIAVLVSDKVMRHDAFQYRLDLAGDLMNARGRDDVDLILLNQAPPLLAHRVLSKGKLVLERSASARVAFQVRAVNRYLDTQPIRNIYMTYLKKQVREGRNRG